LEKLDTRRAKEEALCLVREMIIRECRADFWMFCKIKAPNFYTDDKPYLRDLCRMLQSLYRGELMRTVDEAYKKAIINMPPRYGKTRTLILFTEWCLGDNPTNRIIATSYNDKTASDFSRYTRDGIMETKNLPHQIVFSDIFPLTKIKEGNASFEKFAVEGQYFSYLGAGIGGSITGKGGNILFVDDPVKDAATAYNEDALEKIYKWYTGTFLSRKEKDAIEIIDMTRWADGDLTGRVLAEEGSDEWYIYKLEAKDLETGEYLCEAIIDEPRYVDLKRSVDELIFMANYHQTPINQQGSLYKTLQTYEPEDLVQDGEDGMPISKLDRIIAYCDTADEGDCYLALIIAGECQGDLYLLEVYYTKDDMSITELEAARLLSAWGVDVAKIESNNGGRGFARAVQRILLEKYAEETEQLTDPEDEDTERQWKRVPIKWFHQSENKDARILSNSAYIQQHVFFPVNWNIAWPQFHKSITTYQREGSNKYKDAPDALTGLVEMTIRSRPKARLI